LDQPTGGQLAADWPKERKLRRTIFAAVSATILVEKRPRRAYDRELISPARGCAAGFTDEPSPTWASVTDMRFSGEFADKPRRAGRRCGANVIHPSGTTCVRVGQKIRD